MLDDCDSLGTVHPPANPLLSSKEGPLANLLFLFASKDILSKAALSGPIPISHAMKLDCYNTYWLENIARGG